MEYVYEPVAMGCLVGFRGAPDKDTADVDCIGFYGRKLYFGEGLVVQSPCNVSKYLEIEMPTEDDVLHADDLPTFNDTLSREEAELLFSFLTVDYVRLPLLLNFFADKDRVTYLFNKQLQDLLKGILFEGGPWVPIGNCSQLNVCQKDERISKL